MYGRAVTREINPVITRLVLVIHDAEVGVNYHFAESDVGFGSMDPKNKSRDNE